MYIRENLLLIKRTENARVLSGNQSFLNFPSHITKYSVISSCINCFVTFLSDLLFLVLVCFFIYTN